MRWSSRWVLMFIALIACVIQGRVVYCQGGGGGVVGVGPQMRSSVHLQATHLNGRIQACCNPITQLGP